MPGIIISQPVNNQVVVPDQPFQVIGSAFDRGMPEPIIIESVTVTADGLTTDATLKPGVHNSVWYMSYSAAVRVSNRDGLHLIAVTATNDQGRSMTKRVTVFVGVPPLNSAFDAVATLRTTNSRAMGPYLEHLPIGLQFSADRRVITLTGFPPIHNESNTQGAHVVVDITLAGGGVGVFNPQDGTMTVPITLSFHVVVTFGPFTIHNGTSMLGVVLSTGAESSPTGAFKDVGHPLLPDGTIKLVGDGSFSGDPAGLGGSDASLVLEGRISPHP